MPVAVLRYAFLPAKRLQTQPRVVWPLAAERHEIATAAFPESAADAAIWLFLRCFGANSEFVTGE
jgi:hypothetical protein